MIEPLCSALALFRVPLDEALGEEHEAEDLAPFGDDIANDLSPLSLRIGSNEQPDPDRSGQKQKNTQRMVSEMTQCAREKSARRRLLALLGAPLVQVLGRKDHDDQPGPVSDGVAEERSPVRLGIGNAVQQDPGEKDGAGHDAERMASQEAYFTAFSLFAHAYGTGKTRSELPDGGVAGCCC